MILISAVQWPALSMDSGRAGPEPDMLQTQLTVVDQTWFGQGIPGKKKDLTQLGGFVSLMVLIQMISKNDIKDLYKENVDGFLEVVVNVSH